MSTTTLTCPSCGGELTELGRSGVRIDACRSCRGVWLDRGELDKIIEREARERDDDDDFMRELTGARTKRRDDDGDDRRRYDQHPSSGQDPPKKKKRGFLGEMFEFGD
jgi:Zn-finger nucleic acid-binding protein